MRKTLVNRALTALLAPIYLGAVVVSWSLFIRLAGMEQSTLAVVVSTLAIAALFTPLRRLIQDAIDRRFFREKYDAQQVLAQFVQTARDETDPSLSTQDRPGRADGRIGARGAEDAAEPEHVSGWLRKQEAPKAPSGLLEERS